MLHHGACTNQMKEYRELIFPLQCLQNTQGHILQEKKWPLQQVLASFYPEDVISKSLLNISRNLTGSKQKNTQAVNKFQNMNKVMTKNTQWKGMKRLGET